MLLNKHPRWEHLESQEGVGKNRRFNHKEFKPRTGARKIHSATLGNLFVDKCERRAMYLTLPAPPPSAIRSESDALQVSQSAQSLFLFLLLLLLRPCARFMNVRCPSEYYTTFGGRTTTLMCWTHHCQDHLHTHLSAFASAASSSSVGRGDDNRSAEDELRNYNLIA